MKRRISVVLCTLLCSVVLISAGTISSSAETTINHYVTLGLSDDNYKDTLSQYYMYDKSCISYYTYEDSIKKGVRGITYGGKETLTGLDGEYGCVVRADIYDKGIAEIYGRNKGTAKVGIVYDNGDKEVFNVTIKDAPSSVTTDKNGITMGIGEVCKFSAYTNSGSWARNITWDYYADYMDIVSVDNTLTATAKKAGNVSVTARTYNNLTSTSNVAIKNAPTSLSLNKKSITLGVGEKFDLNSYVNSGAGAYYRPFSSSNSNVASVTKSGGIVTAKQPGTAKITVKTYNGLTATCTVTVKNAPIKVSLNKSKITLGIGEQFDLNSYLPSGTASYKVSYSSNNSSVVAVNSSGGLMTAKKVGTATITAKTFNGKTATCVVTVKKAPTSISLNKSKLTLNVGKTYDLNSSLPAGTGAYSIKYYSNNSSVASVVSSGGLVTAKKAGTAVITARTYNGKTATCTVTVK